MDIFKKLKHEFILVVLKYTIILIHRMIFFRTHLEKFFFNLQLGDSIKFLILNDKETSW